MEGRSWQVDFISLALSEMMPFTFRLVRRIAFAVLLIVQMYSERLLDWIFCTSF